MDKIEQLQELIDKSQRIVFFGGAGVSTESNIPDFRSSDGIYSLKLGRHFTAEQLVSRTMFERYPEDFFDFYKKYLVYPDAKPGWEFKKESPLRDLAIEKYEALFGKKAVIEAIHAGLECGFWDGKMENVDIISMGPDMMDVHTVQEALDMDVFSRAARAIQQADLLIIGGTSLVVYPAASLINYFSGSNLVVINKSSTPQDSQADLVIEGKIGEVFSKLRQ